MIPVNDAVKRAVASHAGRPVRCCPGLHAVQDEFGCVPAEAVPPIARR